MRPFYVHKVGLNGLYISYVGDTRVYVDSAAGVGFYVGRSDPVLKGMNVVDN
ncbi:MAG: hypothetical protein N2201_00755 [candidate division WOR-3 bacterium]|nr:hypothetical protein [candidate division WOR-3 bacterium]